MPKNPDTHAQLNAVSSSTAVQVPPFSHGLLAHGAGAVVVRVSAVGSAVVCPRGVVAAGVLSTGVVIILVVWEVVRPHDCLSK